MLRNLDPLLSPDLLHTLRSMGHGDEIVIADANFPATSTTRLCLRADGSSATDILRAVLSVMPLDDFLPDPAMTMQVVDAPDSIPDVVGEFRQIIATVADVPAETSALERFAFYERAAKAFAVVQTGERRLYGNIILRKGVIR